MNQHNSINTVSIGQYALPVVLCLFLGGLLYAVLKGKPDMAVFCGIFSVAAFVANCFYRQSQAADYHVLRKLQDCPQLTVAELERMLMHVLPPCDVRAAIERLHSRGIIRARQGAPDAPLTYVVNEAPYFIGAPE